MKDDVTTTKSAEKRTKKINKAYPGIGPSTLHALYTYAGVSISTDGRRCS